MRGKGLLGVIAFSSFLWAQMPSPLELPEVVIVGQGERRIPRGAKQEPHPPSPLPDPVLDTLAPLHRHALMDFLSLPAFPTTLALPPTTERMVEGGVGQYTTAWLKGYQRWRWERTALNLAVQAAGTQGHRRSADSVGLGCVAHLRLHLPTAAWIFRESTAEAAAIVRWKRYRLFGDISTPRRLLFEGGISADFSGSLERLDYGLGGKLHLLLLNHEGRGSSEQQITFHTWAIYPNAELPSLGVNARLNLRLWEERTQTVSEVALPVLWGKSSLVLQGKLGFQGARAYTGAGFFVPLLEGALQYALSPQWRAVLGLWSRLHEAGLREMVEQNPYVAFGAEPPLQHERIGARIALGWVAQPQWEIEVALRLRSVARWWGWQRDSAGFSLQALPLTALEGSVNALWERTQQERLGVQLQGGWATAQGSERVPYYTPLAAAVYYDRQWQEQVGSTVGIELVGARWGKWEKLPGYARLWGEIRIDLSAMMRLVLSIDNTLNSDIVHWEGYRERGIFIGATARLLW